MITSLAASCRARLAARRRISGWARDGPPGSRLTAFSPAALITAADPLLAGPCRTRIARKITRSTVIPSAVDPGLLGFAWGRRRADGALSYQLYIETM